MDPQGHRSREQSSIAFPYVDLSAAIEVASAIQRRSGTGGCDLNDLATDFEDGLGGAFRLKTSAARIFDLIEKRGRSEVRLTESGRQIVSEEHGSAARAQAFLRVPLYAAIFDRFKNTTLPPKRELEIELKAMGVPAKQVDKARQVFERSARQAGLFDGGDHKLALPAANRQQIGNSSIVARQPMMDSNHEIFDPFDSRVGLLTRYGREDPLIVGLLERLPASGAPWPDDARIAWLRLANSIFNVTYGEGSGTIEVTLTGNKETPQA